MATNLSGDETSHQFGGLSLAEVYSVTLTCVFGSDQFDCGTAAVSTSPPDMVHDGHVYSVSHVASTWHEAEDTCVSGGGHLVSLGNMKEETRVTVSLSVTDIWTGGNMCPDSPAPRHSMWTDGSDNDHTNFATDSGKRNRNNADENIFKMNVIINQDWRAVIVVSKLEQWGGEEVCVTRCYTECASLTCPTCSPTPPS